eukprot:CAMPEP_0115662334 /NCGR_PEP_ID=MMETSP0272-20121206/47259_1 /TAXON_ID=71861 /ORGANISM="Scrippsiella trochoidea, Strain CCMP3099" /LENGTH=40 /DNA_ID= /DNA_START= /DNA_END= /DNA_ORIENTATION=
MAWEQMKTMSVNKNHALPYKKVRNATRVQTMSVTIDTIGW